MPAAVLLNLHERTEMDLSQSLNAGTTATQGMRLCEDVPIFLFCGVGRISARAVHFDDILPCISSSVANPGLLTLRGDIRLINAFSTTLSEVAGIWLA